MKTQVIACTIVCLAAAGLAAGQQALFTPPAGAKVIYRCDFESGLDGWSGELTKAKQMPGSKAALKVGGGRKWTSRKLKVPITGETVLSFYVRTDDSPWVIIQCFNLKHRENCKSYWYLYPNRDYGKWVHVRLPLAGTLVDCASNWKWTPQPGDTLGNVQLHIIQGRTILVDNVLIYTMDAAGKLAQARAELKKILTDLPGLSRAGRTPPGAVKAWSAAAAQLDGQAKKLAAKKQVEWAEGQALYHKAAALKTLVERSSSYYAKSVAAFGKDPDFAIGTEHSMVRISDEHWMYPFRGRVSGSVELASAGHEYESFQAVILPFTRELKRVKVKFGDLRQAGGKGVIPAANLTWRTQPYVQLLPCHGYPGYDWVAPKPDPLLPGEPFDVPAAGFKPLWVTVYTPPDTPPGRYAGTMTVAATQARPLSLKINLRVWNYRLPLTGRFRCQTHMNMNPVAKFYGRKFDQKWRRQWYAFLLKYRFSPTMQYSKAFTPFPDDIEFCKARGCNVWILGGLSGVKEVPLEEFGKRYAIARKHGILKYCHVYIGDETSNFPLMRRKANVIHKNFPGLKVMIGGSRPRKELIGYIDIWDPIIDTNPLYGFSPREMRQARRRGEEVMWYTAAAPQHPYPNVHMGDPLFASRMLFWLTWKYRITGFEYYCFSIWGKNIGIKPRWPKSPWNCYSFDRTNGDGQLSYPGPGGAPAASVRLENIRDGIEDWEALYMLEGAAECLKKQLIAGRIAASVTVAVGKEKLSATQIVKHAQGRLGFGDAFCKDVTHWALDPHGLLDRRNRVSRLIEAVVSLVGRAELEKFQAKRIADREALEAKRLEENRQRAIKELKEAEPKK